MKKLLYIFLAAVIFSSCSQGDPSFEPIGGGEVLSGSYANMLTLGDFLYVLGDGGIKTFSIEDRAKPELLNSQDISFEIESLFITGQNIFVGSQQGMFIYRIDEEGIPVFLSETTYNSFSAESCFSDPIAANENYAYSTLANNATEFNSPCFRPALDDQMQIYDITQLTSPVLVNTIFMNEPKGIALDGNNLFVCESSDGLKIFDLTNPGFPEQTYHFPGFSAFDLIPANGLLMVIGQDTLHQFDYSDIDNVTKIGQFALLD